MATAGLLYTVILFLCCFAAVHVVKLAKIGSDSLKGKPEEPKKRERKAPRQKSKPVYYIVEKKRTGRQNYGEPRKINFDDE